MDAMLKASTMCMSWSVSTGKACVNGEMAWESSLKTVKYRSPGDLEFR